MLSNKGDDGKPSLSYGTWAQTVAKVTLKEITCPADQPESEKIVMRKDANGFVHDELLSKLERFGVVDDIFGAFITLQKKTKSVGDTKNL